MYIICLWTTQKLIKLHTCKRALEYAYIPRAIFTQAEGSGLALLVFLLSLFFDVFQMDKGGKSSSFFKWNGCTNILRVRSGKKKAQRIVLHISDGKDELSNLSRPMLAADFSLSVPVEFWVLGDPGFFCLLVSIQAGAKGRAPKDPNSTSLSGWSIEPLALGDNAFSEPEWRSSEDLDFPTPWFIDCICARSRLLLSGEFGSGDVMARPLLRGDLAKAGFLPLAVSDLSL